MVYFSKIEFIQLYCLKMVCIEWEMADAAGVAATGPGSGPGTDAREAGGRKSSREGTLPETHIEEARLLY